MPYRILQADPSLEAALRRIAREQIGSALGSLEATGEERAAAVHDVRKRCKKLRGLLRLVRPAFPGFAAENAALRDIARLLGGTRDASVLQQTFDAVARGEAAASLDPAALASLRTRLAPPEQEGAAVDLDALFAEARTRLEEVGTRAAGWSLRADGWDALAPGLTDSYARARRARKLAAAKPTTERHHDWRKRVKDHWYHTRLLRRIQPAELDPRSERARELSELLGHHHDLHVLEEALSVRPVAKRAPEAAKFLRRLARDGRVSLEERAQDLGRELQADEPAALASRWGEWWHAWRGEGVRQAAALAG